MYVRYVQKHYRKAHNAKWRKEIYLQKCTYVNRHVYICVHDKIDYNRTGSTKITKNPPMRMDIRRIILPLKQRTHVREISNHSLEHMHPIRCEKV